MSKESRLWDTQKLSVYVDGDKVAHYYPERWTSPKEVAIQIADRERLAPGRSIRLRQGVSSWSYLVGRSRYGGLHEVKRVKRTRMVRSR